MSDPKENTEYGDELICPYCGHENHVEAEDYGNDGDTEEWECYKCEKNFTYHINYSVSFNSQTAECLNGGEHDFKEKSRHKIDGGFLVFERCETCDRTKREKV